MFKDRAAIVGIAETAYAKRLDESEAALAARVVLDACADAGISPAEIDGMVSYTVESVLDTALSNMVGTGDLRFFANVGYGGGAGPGCIGLLAMSLTALNYANPAQLKKVQVKVNNLLVLQANNDASTP